MERERLYAYALALPESFAAAVAEAVKEITRRTPAPRPMPFFAIDLPEGCGSRALDRLSDVGIFRYYEHVLELGAGLGGCTRWLARRRGCRAVGIDPGEANTQAASRLTARAHLEGQVAHARAEPGRLPVRAASFTHAWSIESLHREPEKIATFREAYRAVRPGGHMAIQDWIVRQAGCGPESWPYEAAATYVDGLREAGFVDVRLVDASSLREPVSAVAEVLWQRVGELVPEPAIERWPDLERWHHALEEREVARQSGALTLCQVFATKPSWAGA